MVPLAHMNLPPDGEVNPFDHLKASFDFS